MPELLPEYHSDLESLRPFSRTELVAFDLDGTLLPSALVLKFQELSRSLRRHGVGLVVATGRTLAGVEPLLQRLELDRTAPLILYNGSLVVENSTFRVLSRRTIPRRAVYPILDVCSSAGLPALAYYFNDPVREFLELFGSREIVHGWFVADDSFELPQIEVNGLRIDWKPAGSYEDVGAEPSAVLVPIARRPDLAPHLLRAFGTISEITVTQSGAAYLEIRPAGSHKAVALQEVSNWRTVMQEDVLAIGDNDNDVEMLDWAGIGVAVHNASPKARVSADYVTRHGTFAGVVEVLRLIKNSKRYFNQ